MATTPNYSWIMPDPTDLVKDLPADFAIFGNAVDSTVKTNADAAIAKTIVDAKGDIIAATAADTVSRLAVGANDTVLTADSSTATGLKWAAPASGGMTLISTTTLTGSSVTLSSIPQTYINLKLVIRNHRPVSDSYIRARFNGITTSSYFSNDVLNGYYSTNDYTGSEVSYLDLTGIGQTDASDNANFYVLNFEDYTNTVTHKIGNWNMKKESNNGTGKLATFGMWVFESTNAISSIVLSNSTGDFTSGTALLYGVK